MYRVLILATVITIVLASSVFAQEDGWTGNINAFLGAKALNNDDWSPAEDQGEIGIKFDFRPKSWPVNIAIDYNYAQSNDEDFFDPTLGNGKFQSTTTELNIGAKADITAPAGSASDSDTGTGIWFGGGVYWTIADHFNLGLDLEVSSADVTLFNVDVNSGGGHFGFLAGYHW
jgi:hypothetical protein